MKTSKTEGPIRVFRILLVDDNRNGLIVRKGVLEESGYEVFACSTPEEALSQFLAEQFDLVVTDYRMPRMTGDQLITEIRKVKPAMPIVLVSGVVDILGLDEKTTGADIVIHKSSTEATHLVRAANRLLSNTPKKKPTSTQAAKRATKTKIKAN